jgi:hypothetical protein
MRLTIKRVTARGIELTRIAGALQVAQDLFVDIAKQVTFAGAAEVDFVELVDHRSSVPFFM